MTQEKLASFGIIMSSDPQYPWYNPGASPDLTGVVPLTPLTKEEDQYKYAYAQVRRQYDDMNLLVGKRQAENSKFQIEGSIINGDLTAFGHDWQYDKYMGLYNSVLVKQYPGLGNHDYDNNVGDSYNNNCATRMVKFMYDWLKSNSQTVSFDFRSMSYYLCPSNRTDYVGSLAYSFNIGKVHFVQLHNYPFYERAWDSWDAAGADRDFFYIKSSMLWLERDLATARNKGDIIILCMHNYPCGETVNFGETLKKYGVSAIFCGHFHDDCGLIDYGPLPYFRSGGAFEQTYLVADIDIEARTMTVRERKRRDPEDFRYDESNRETYSFAYDRWTINLIDTVPSAPLPVPAVSYPTITIVNKGVYTAKCEITYTRDGKDQTESSGDMTEGSSMSFYLYPSDTNIRIKAEEYPFIATLKTIFELQYDTSVDRRFQLEGTTLFPTYKY